MQIFIIKKKIIILFVCLFFSACAGIQRDPGGLSEIAAQPEKDRNTFAEHESVAENNPSDPQKQDSTLPPIIENNNKDVALLNVEESEKNVVKEPLWPTETGYATYYAPGMEGNLTASGEPYDSEQLTAAHRTIPIGSVVRVTNPETQRHVTVRINDRWGGGGDRIVNLSRQAAVELGFGTAGMIFVHLDVESIPAGRSMYAGPQPVPLPSKIQADQAVNHSKLSICQNEADILGLSGDFFRNHVLGCLERGQ